MTFRAVLTLIFIVLKLTGTIAWSWFWVVSPMIFEVGLYVAVGILVLVIALVVTYVEQRGA